MPKTESSIHEAQQVRSMTAFARQQFQGGWGTLTLETRTVNHRFLDATVRMPESIRVLESEVRETLRNKLNRGKVELNVRFEPGEQTTQININPAVTKQLNVAGEEITKLLPNTQGMRLSEVLQWPGVVQTTDLDMEIIKPVFTQALDTLLESLQENRAKEGAALAQLITDRLDKIASIVEKLRPQQEEAIKLQREKILSRIEEAKVAADPNRIEQELVIWAQKTDIAEELDRLAMHIQAVSHALKKGGAIGRRLDFLMQELNREANTLGSKSVSIVTTNASVEIKVLIEQMREQVQNIE
jgi:uncharacterized protein (TIGR00255 family)